MVKNNFGKRGTDTSEPVPVVVVESELAGEEPESTNSIVSLVLVGLIAASVGVGGIFAWSQKDTIVAQVDDWKRTAMQLKRNSPTEMILTAVFQHLAPVLALPVWR